MGRIALPFWNVAGRRRIQFYCVEKPSLALSRADALDCLPDVALAVERPRDESGPPPTSAIKIPTL